ncbi:MAG: glycosyltransferase family 2 protein [Verrucomicrobia bacterium]|nr:glycosyltransferase family 2 protein [Verrucomicrobiota bacterium]
MNFRIDLIWFGDTAAPAAWSLGEVVRLDATPAAVHALVENRLRSSTSDAWLFWDGSLGLPEAKKLESLLAMPGDVWHAGLRLGMAGQPALIDAVASTWMLSCDPDPNIEATSWRLSLRACLIRTGVLRQVGGVRPDFESLAGAALEFGHRLITRGVLIRHLPSLISSPLASTPFTPIPFADELRFVYYRFGKFWTRFALLRAVLEGRVSLAQACKQFRAICRQPKPTEPPPYQHAEPIPTEDFFQARVTVLIPTVDRYPYLRTLLEQLRQQTVPPCQIIVVDQSAAARRDTSLPKDFADLPLQVLYQDQPGQCASRNAGLQLAEGDFVLFLDDDDEVKPQLIEAHLRNLHRFGADVSAGVADEVGAGPLPENFKFIRASDVFPTNNSLIRKSILRRSGLFDLAYNRGQRADGDLGMRLYLSGALMILNSEISVLHHHAPSGGLRLHKARVITYASSRARLNHRQLVSATEIYMAYRYFTRQQLKEMLWHAVLGTFSIRGGKVRKLLKCAISLVCLPHSLWQLRQRHAAAEMMLREFPKIPQLANG